jgi:hypothetical protein
LFSGQPTIELAVGQMKNIFLDNKTADKRLPDTVKSPDKDFSVFIH